MDSTTAIVSPRRYRWVSALAIALLSGAAALGPAGVAAADPPSNSTPGSAVAISSVPFDAYGGHGDNPVADDPAGQLVAQTCNGGAPIYGTQWWKYTAPSKSTFVVHAALAVSGPSVEEPIGMAVVAGDLGSVLKCGVEGTSISDAGAFTLSAGQAAYVVTYFHVATETTIVPPHVGLYPSTGVVPANDDMASATPITSLPYTKTQDTTLATREPSEPGCYSKFGVGPSVWYSVSVPSDQLLDVAVDSDYGATFVIVPSDDDAPNAWICESRFQAKAGVTYKIGIYGVDEVRNSGQATISVSAVPTAPTISATISSTGTVNKKKGVVRLTGKVTCSGNGSTEPVTGTIKQTYKRVIHQQSFTGSTASCTGQPSTWTAKIKPTNFKWTTGKAKISISVTACNSGGCTTATATKTVTLKAA